MFATGENRRKLLEKGLNQFSDEEEISCILDAVIAGDPGSVEDYRKGKRQCWALVG